MILNILAIITATITLILVQKKKEDRLLISLWIIIAMMWCIAEAIK